jgi:hypothetical protein
MSGKAGVSGGSIPSSSRKWRGPIVVIKIEENKQLDSLIGMGSCPEKSGWGPLIFCRYGY